MVAARDILPCEMILSEKPAVVGPYARTSPGCLQCFKKVDDSYLCPGKNNIQAWSQTKQEFGLKNLEVKFEQYGK